MATVSELEGVVLGILQARQPCTAYAVRTVLSSSPSSHWSASAGAIYPLLSRLEAAGLVRFRVDESDGRGRRLATLTADGNRALRDWMLRASTPEIAASVSDALRTRAFFLKALRPADRERFVREALEAAEAFLALAREYEASDDRSDGFERLAARGGVHAAEARVRWLKELRAFLDPADS